MKREEKAEVIEEIAARIGEADAIYAVDYRGITVTQVAALRGSLREVDTSFRIVKNTLTLRAADQAGVEHVKGLVEGPTAFAFVRGDAALAAKVLDTFARRERVLEIRGGVLDGQPLTADALKQLARLPGREQLNAQLAGVVASPLTGLVRGIGALLSGVAIALGQVYEQRKDEAPIEQTAPEPEAEAPAEAPAVAAETQEDPSGEERDTSSEDSTEEDEEAEQ
jgi:large subunit ribosomal protein L10